jgi:hypothetical protein
MPLSGEFLVFKQLKDSDLVLSSRLFRYAELIAFLLGDFGFDGDLACVIYVMSSV